MKEKVFTPSLLTRLCSLCIASLIFAFALLPSLPRASANGLDYNDYIDHIVVDGDNQLVTIRIPMNHTWSQIRVNDTLVGQSASNSVSWESRDEGTQTVLWYMARNTSSISTSEPFRFDLSYIPNGSVFSVGSLWDIDASTANPTLQLNLYAYPYGSTSSQYTSTSTPVTVHPQTLEYVSAPLKKGEGAYTLNILLIYRGFLAITLPEVIQRFTISEVLCTISIPSLVREQEESGRTNKILQAVEQQLAENGQKLDDILTGDSLDAPYLDEFQNNVSSDKDAFETGFESVDSNVPKPDVSDLPDVMDFIDTPVLETTISSLSVFWQYPVFSGMLMIGLCLTLIAYVFFGKRD